MHNDGKKEIKKDRIKLSLRFVFIGAEFAFPSSGFSTTLTPKGSDIKKIISHIIRWTRMKDTILILKTLYSINVDFDYWPFGKS